VSAAAAAAALVAELLAHGASDADVAVRCCLSLSELPLSELPAGTEAVAAVTSVVVGGSARVQHAGYCALEKLAEASAANRAALAAHGAINAVVAALQVHRGDRHIVEYGCKVLEAYVNCEAANARAAGAAGAVEALVEAMAAHVQNLAVLSWASGVLNVLLFYDDTNENARRAGASGAVGTLLSIMRAHAGDARAQWWGCAALANLVNKDATSRIQAINAGAVEAIIAALNSGLTQAGAGADDMQLLVQGCMALGNVCKESIAAVDARSTTLVGDATKTVMAALDAHPADSELQHRGCFALGAFAGGRQAGVARAGAIPAVVRALRLHPASAGVQGSCCTALTELCQVDTHNAVAACSEGAIALIAAAMRAFHGDDQANVQTRACLALRDIISTTAAQDAARTAGAVEAVVLALHAHPANPVVQFAGCATLVGMVYRNTLNIRAAVAAGAIDAVVAAFAVSAPTSADRANARTTPYAACCLALDKLIHESGDDEAHARIATSAGALEAVLEYEQPRHGQYWSEAGHQRLLEQLRAAAARHDADGACAAAGCKRCATMRARGQLCAAPGCGARRRADDAARRLLRCGRCRVTAYCCVAHQRADWARHKPDCRRATQQADAAP
jgi:hypothetical protein